MDTGIIIRTKEPDDRWVSKDLSGCSREQIQWWLEELDDAARGRVIHVLVEQFKALR